MKQFLRSMLCRSHDYDMLCEVGKSQRAYRCRKCHKIIVAPWHNC